jgi:hypothetical protein
MRTLARQLDQFYTQPALAATLVAALQAHLGPLPSGTRFLEPSAGKGAFLDPLPADTLALDLAPADPRVKPGDFLAFRPAEGPWVVVGNPPFGKNASLAIRFFNHAATFAQVIAFIVPRTFEKASVHNRLDPAFHLTYSQAVPEDAFEFEGQPIHVPCVFQVWQRQADAPRVRVRAPLTHPDFTYVDRATADFAFQRVGAKAGTIKSLNGPDRGLAAASHHFIRVTQRKRVAQVRAVFERLDWASIKHRTAGNPSIAKTEIVAAYTAAT